MEQVLAIELTLHGVVGQLTELMLHLVETCQLLLGRRIYVLLQASELLYLLDLLLHRVDHAVEVFEADLRLFLKSNYRLFNKGASIGNKSVPMALNMRDVRRMTYEDELKLTQVAHWRQTEQTLLQVDEEVVART